MLTADIHWWTRGESNPRPERIHFTGITAISQFYGRSAEIQWAELACGVLRATVSWQSVHDAANFSGCMGPV